MKRSTTLPLRRLAGLALLAALAACSRPASQLAALEPGPDAACALDGMLLQEAPGPKAQLRHDEGAPEFYCDLNDLFAQLLAPEQKRPVAAVYVQDMAGAAWEHPQGHWIDAKGALYVAGSARRGAMGPAIASFAHLADARAFAAREGGSVLRYGQVTLAMLRHDGAARP